MNPRDTASVVAAKGLRVLVACHACKRQVDATGVAAGSRVRCDCGDVIEVPKTRPHDAAVVRCSSCGGPRAGGEPTCGHCGADFTIHERDLDTLCPGCMTRITRAARYCHGCGLAIHVDGSAGELTDKRCPACGKGRRLAARALGEKDLPAHECRTCAGLWLGPDVVAALERAARLREAGLPAGPTRAGAPELGEAIYRPCPDCATRMHRRNYGRKSGVMVDVCTAHGSWFDAGELDAVLRWVEEGGLTKARRQEIEEETARRRGERLKSLEPEHISAVERSIPWDVLF